MKACVCVDYLSHEWSSNDLIQAHRELKRQRSKTQFNITTKYEIATKKELKKLSIEKVRQIRYQNAIWRQMARSCTKTLSWSNEMIHPSSVNWQKESDITWLYGPLYMPPESTKSSDDLNTHPSLSFLLSPSSSSLQSATAAKKTIPSSISTKSKSTLKPVLKKNIPSASSVMLQKDYWLTNDRYWSKAVSESGKQSVRFDPHITKVKFLPETPVKESFKSSYFDLDSEGEDDDEEETEEEEIWKVIMQVGSYLKCVLFSSLFGTIEATTVTTKQVIKRSTTELNNHHLIQFCISAVSFTAWIMYQTFSTLMNRTPSPFAYFRTQKQQKQQHASRLLERKNKNINALIV